jgi:cytochrome c553
MRDFEDKLEMVAEMLETARALVTELENAETVETETDLESSVTEARNLAKALIETSTVFGSCCKCHGSGGPKKLSCGEDVYLVKDVK